jgi:hypothetical protein
MKRFPTLLPTLTVLSVLAACGGQETPPPADEPATQAAPATGAAASAGGLSCTPQGATPPASQRVSPQRTLSFNMGSVRGLLCYGAPSVQGREIMGGIVPNGQPWRLGDDDPTTLHLSGRANMGGVALEPGSYSLYAIPGQAQWEFFINSNWQRPGIPIDAAVRSTEVGSFTVVPQRTAEMVEELRFEWEEAPGGDPGGELLLEWENTLLRIPIEA